MGLKFSAVLILVIAAMGGLGYWYYNDTQERMAILNENNAKLETAVATNEEALKAQKEAFEAMARENEKLRTDFDAIKKRNDRLQEKLSRHDIGNLGVARPESTGKVLSTQSNNALRCFEIAPKMVQMATQKVAFIFSAGWRAHLIEFNEFGIRWGLELKLE